MAGGQGQRFWPLSTPSRPKQFLDLGHTGRTLLQSTYDRVLPLSGAPGRIMVATSEAYVKLVKEQLPELPHENLLIEPTPRDSAPAIALACLAIEERFGASTVAGFFSSDHEVGNAPAFTTCALSAIQLAAEHNGLVTIGIIPSRPATGYGYIEVGEALGPGHRVGRFVEKPNLPTAESYVKGGQHLWNAGIFVWRVGTALA